MLKKISDTDILTRNDFQTLIREHNGLCVSIYLPTHHKGKEIEQDLIRFKNLLNKAEKFLIREGMRAAVAKNMLAQARKLLENPIFWHHQSDGLAAFISAKLFRYLRLPLRFDELVEVAGHFHIKPLFPLLASNRRFYLLSLSKNKVKLLQGTDYSISDIDSEEIPKNINEYFPHKEFERQLSFRAGASTGRAGGYHGRGEKVDELKSKIRQYFRHIDKSARKVLADGKAPLVLAGAQYFLPLYKEINTYPYLFDEYISGNPDDISGEELHKRAWSILQPYFKKPVSEARIKCEKLLGADSFSSDLKMVVPAAERWDVDSLFVVAGSRQWGTYNPDAFELRMHNKEEPGDDDLFDYAIIHTYLHKGNIYVVDSTDDVPGNTLLAAVFRHRDMYK